MTSRHRSLAAILAGSANTSAPSFAASFADRTDGNDTAMSPAGLGPDFRREAGEQAREPGPAGRGLVERREGACIPFEKCDVRTEAADGDLEGGDAPPAERGEGLGNEGRFAVPARRDQEDLLSVGEVRGQAAELDVAADKRRRAARPHRRQTGFQPLVTSLTVTLVGVTITYIDVMHETSLSTHTEDTENTRRTLSAHWTARTRDRRPPPEFPCRPSVCSVCVDSGTFVGCRA